MPKKINYSELIKETLILTVAVAVIAAAVFFFLVPTMHPSAVFPVLESFCRTSFLCSFLRSQ